MRAAALLPLALGLAVAGCGAAAAPRPAPTASEAEPRELRLRWRETYGSGGEQLVFEVRRFVVRDEAWEAEVAIENRSTVPFRIGRPERAERTFGVMLFPTGDVKQLEELARSNGLPPLRDAQKFEPELPDRLAPGSAWRGTISSRGSLPAGLYVRLVFGRLFAEAKVVPEGLAADVSWITDHAFRL